MCSDKFGFFYLSTIFSFFESYALFSDKNEIIEYTNCSISTHPLSQGKKLTHAYVFTDITDVTENSILGVISLVIFFFHPIHKHEVY